MAASGPTLPVEAGSVGVFPGYADQLAVGVEGPGVIEALQYFGVPRVAAADLSAPVGTGIEKHPYLTVPATDKEKRPTGHGTAPVVPCALHFRLVTQVDPAPVEYQFLLSLEQFRGGHGRPVDLEESPLPIVDDQVLDLHKFTGIPARQIEGVASIEVASGAVNGNQRSILARQNGLISSFCCWGTVGAN